MNDFAGLSGPTGVQWHGAGHGLAQFGDDSRLVVIFYVRSVRNEAKTREIGAPYHDNMTFVKIHEPGERLSIVDRPARDDDKQRFPTQWGKFLQNREQVPEGTPLELLFPNNAALADNLKSQGVYTVQQLANLSANAIDNIGMGGQEWKNMANKYLSSANDGVAFHELKAELDKKTQDHKILQSQFDELKRQFNGVLEKINNPLAASIQPPWVEGHDAQEERLNANHPSVEVLVESSKKKRKTLPPPSETPVNM